MRSANYVNLKSDQALNWYIVYDGLSVVGFCGIHQSQYFLENDIARIMYRTYLVPKVRKQGMTISRINWKQSGRQQMQFCIDRKLTPIISRENPKTINNICHYLHKTHSHIWKIAPGFYWTGNKGMTDNQNCWQKITVYGELKALKNLPNISDEQYKSLFK